MNRNPTLKASMYWGMPLCSGTRRSEWVTILEDDDGRVLLGKIVFEVLLFDFEVFVFVLFSSFVSDEKSICDIDDNELWLFLWYLYSFCILLFWREWSNNFSWVCLNRYYNYKPFSFNVNNKMLLICCQTISCW